MKIIDLTGDDFELIEQAAHLLIAGFKEQLPEAWPDINSALSEVWRSLVPKRISRIMLSASNNVLGWVAAVPRYYGTGWELHPLVVHPDYQGQGIGRSLVANLEKEVKRRGGIAIYVGADDEYEGTSLGGHNLYPNVFEHVAAIKNLRRHPFEFYQKVGYTITGVIPDANGPGKPDIIMAKRLK